MARVATIVKALWTSVRRESKSLGSFTNNNLFTLSVVLLFFGDPGAFAAINFLIGLILFFPLSTNPLRKLPPERFALWPLSRRERWAVQMTGPWLNPITWLLVFLAVWKGVSRGLWAVVAGLFAVVFVVPSLPMGGHKGMWRRLPNFPGPLNQLVRKNLRQTFSTLDFYCALLLSGAACVFRARHLLPADALFPMTVLVMLALSTNAQSLFGLDGEGGMTRYRLLPVPGWQVLVAKDAAFLLTALLLTLPLSPMCGLAAALAALAVGHSAAVNQRRPQTRWRFSTGASFGGGILLMFLMVLAAASTNSAGALFLIPCAAAYMLSTWWFGRILLPVDGNTS